MHAPDQNLWHLRSSSTLLLLLLLTLGRICESVLIATAASTATTLQAVILRGTGGRERDIHREREREPRHLSERAVVGSTDMLMTSSGEHLVNKSRYERTHHVKSVAWPDALILKVKLTGIRNFIACTLQLDAGTPVIRVAATKGGKTVGLQF